MKRLLLLVVLTVALCSAGFGQTKKTGWEAYGLHRKVKDLKTAVYTVTGSSDAMTKGKKQSDRHVVFSKKGNRVIITDHLFTDNKIRYTEILKYDENGECIETISYDAKGISFGKNVYRYENDNCVESLSYNSDGNLSRRFISTYDERGNWVEEGDYNGDGSLNERCIYFYDENDFHIGTNRHDSLDCLFEKGIYKLDERGNCIEANFYDGDGNFSHKGTYKYDDNNRCIEDNHYGADGELGYTLVYGYDDKGRKIKDSRYDGLITLFKYDDKGNRVEARNYGPSGTPGKETVYRYKFDRKGNWVVKTTYENGTPVELEERTIKYFGLF